MTIRREFSVHARVCIYMHNNKNPKGKTVSILNIIHQFVHTLTNHSPVFFSSPYFTHTHNHCTRSILITNFLLQSDPENMTETQKERSIVFTFKNTSCFTMTYFHYCPVDDCSWYGGGNFLFRYVLNDSTTGRTRFYFIFIHTPTSSKNRTPPPSSLQPFFCCIFANFLFVC